MSNTNSAIQVNKSYISVTKLFFISPLVNLPLQNAYF